MRPQTEEPEPRKGRARASAPPSLERLVVVGAGAVGGSIGALLAERGLPVALVARGAHGDAIRARGLRVRMPDRALELALPCVDSSAGVEWRAGDVALLATKLQDAEAALDALLHAAGPALPVVCATNGVHAERWAAARFQRVLSMVVWLPATHLEPGEVLLYSAPSRGVLDVGAYRVERNGEDTALHALAEALCARLRGASFDSLAREDIERWKRAKWIANLGNAAQALVGDDWKRVAIAARAEGEAVLDAAELERVPTAELLERVKAVASHPIDGREREGGSTWQSRARGTPLESRWIEGALADLAAEVGVAAPICAFLAGVSRAPRSILAAEVPGLVEREAQSQKGSDSFLTR